MAERVVVDAGPLVALLRQDDQHHDACRVAAAQLPAPFFTTWLAVVESAWLLRNVPDGVLRLLDLLRGGLVVCHHLEPSAVDWLMDFVRKYGDLRPQLADASLVYLADALDTDVIFTLDRRDFTVFRNRHGKPFRLFPEP